MVYLVYGMHMRSMADTFLVRNCLQNTARIDQHSYGTLRETLKESRTVLITVWIAQALSHLGMLQHRAAQQNPRDHIS